MDDNELILPNKEKKLLLHCCCAPCSGGIIESLYQSNIELTILFFNPNIQPKEEYEKRKREIVRYVLKLDIPFVDSDYDQDVWFERIKGFELEPERGKRCSVCFDMRLERSALFAYENGFNIFTSSFGISRWKNMAQVNDSGIRAASRYPNLAYWTHNWRKNNGSVHMQKVIDREQFYLQQYCGCIFSQRNIDLFSSKSSKTADLATKS